MQTILRGLSVLALTAGLGACATVTRGTTQQFTIESTPPAAQARTSSGFNCESTPCTIRMPRKDAFSVTISKAGYKTVKTDVKPKIAGSGAVGFLGNAMIGGVIGAAVDVGSGATLDLAPNPLQVTLEAEGTAAPAEQAPGAAPVAAATTAATAPIVEASNVPATTAPAASANATNANPSK
jgi:hypothetical protein